MDKIDTQIMPVPPNMLASLRAGFDAVANKIAIILIPVGLDLLLWLGPHLQIKQLLTSYINLISSSTISTLETGDVVANLKDALAGLASQFNLLSLLRTFPVGVPSLMASRSPLEIPIRLPLFIDLTNPMIIVGIVLLLILIGLVIGSLYYILVAQISLYGKIDFHMCMSDWVWSSIQVFSLALAMILLFIVVSIPSSCLISSIALFGIPLGQFAFFMYFAIVIWIAFPLIFSAHGIFVNHNNALASVQRSMVMTRMTLPTTALFLLSILLISEGLDILWRVPPEKSWLTLIGLGGHAFITSALLAASFIYYRDADQWTQGTLRILKSRQATLV
ncbi:MAG: hypothetical protein C3F13_11210 [Anaerolineales bacterium]|nr:MAG: hypothetical protein C3F13_11210 [Anaerolineales bacterium]